jgi:hypothetical protein
LIRLLVQETVYDEDDEPSLEELQKQLRIAQARLAKLQAAETRGEELIERARFRRFGTAPAQQQLHEQQQPLNVAEKMKSMRVAKMSSLRQKRQEVRQSRGEEENKEG